MRLRYLMAVGAEVAAAILTATALLVAPRAHALPDCATVAPWTMQCERGTHTSINTTPNEFVVPGPFLQQPWLYSGSPVFGIGGWAVP